MPVSAATLAFDELPSGFVQQIENGDVQVMVDANLNLHSQFETDGFAAYPYLTATGLHFLLDYDVAPGSHCCRSNPFELNGSLFLGVALNYDLNTDGHEIDIYFDQLIPDVGSVLFVSGLPQTTVMMDATAIASGRGVYLASGDPDYSFSGNMNFGEPYGPNSPFFCIECGMTFELNLVYLDYSNGFLTFNPADARANLIVAYDFFDTSPYDYDLRIVVQSVPLPGALLLFASALIGLTLTGSRANRASCHSDPDA